MATTADAGAARRFAPWRVLALIGGLALAAWAFWSLEPARAWAAVRGANPLYVSLALLCICGRFALWTVKWHRMLARHDRVPLGHSAWAILAGAFVNLTTPTAKLGGGILRAELLVRRLHWRRSVAYGQAILDQLSGSLGTLLVLTLAVWFAGGLSDSASTTARAVATSATMVTLVLLLALRRMARRPGATEIGWLRHAARGRLADAGRLLVPLARLRWRELGADVAWSAISMLLLAGSYAFAVQATGAGISLGLAVSLLLSAQMIGTLSGSVGGIGTTEFALIQLSVASGVPGGAAGAGALIQRALFYGFVLLVGGAVFARGATRWSGPERSNAPTRDCRD